MDLERFERERTRAQREAEAAVARAREPEEEARALAALGRALERADEWRPALEAYRAAQALHPRKEVAERIEFAERRLVAPVPLRPVHLRGPFESIDAMCEYWLAEAQRRRAHDTRPPGARCSALETSVDPAGEVLLEARPLLGDYLAGDESDDEHMVAMATEAGWFHSPPLVESPEAGGQRLAITGFDLPREAERRMLRVHAQARASGDGGGPDERVSEAAVFCGVGSSRIPSCTPLIRGVDGPEPAGAAPHRAPLVAEILGVTKLRLRSQKRRIEKFQIDMLGSRYLTFP